jgi:hypothetical protein
MSKELKEICEVRKSCGLGCRNCVGRDEGCEKCNTQGNADVGEYARGHEHQIK